MEQKHFIPGLELCRGFFQDIIQPLMEKGFPDIPYSAALVGFGSDVLGYDNATSIDHGWGPRGQLFFNSINEAKREEIRHYLAANLPLEYKNFPTNFSDKTIDPIQRMEPAGSGPVNHMIELNNLSDYTKSYLKTEHFKNFSTPEWLVFNDQNLLEMTCGEVFYDGLDLIEGLRSELTFYPDDIWKLRLASLWHCIGNEEPFVGRCVESGDFIGVKVISSRIVNYLLKICFYLEKKYIPYSKWFGTALKKLENAPIVSRYGETVLKENDPGRIQDHLGYFYTEIIDLHNKVETLPKLDNKVGNFYGRPYKVISAPDIFDTLMGSIEDEEVKKVNTDRFALDIKLDSVDFTDD